MLTRRAWIIVAASWIVLAVAACSSSGDTDSTTTAPVSSSLATTVAPTTATTAAPTTTSTASTLPPTTTTTLDTTPPVLAVDYPTDGSTVAAQPITATGASESDSTVAEAGGSSTDVGADGTWSIPISLDWGDNYLEFSAADPLDNVATIGLTVRYTPPMPCDGFAVSVEHMSSFPAGPTDWCGGWGYIEGIDLAAGEMVLDLAQVVMNVPGDESEGWSVINQNPGLRTLPLASTIEVRACAPESGSPVPSEACGSWWVSEAWGFDLWSLGHLEGFVAGGHTFWRVLVDPPSGEVVWVEQWWSP